MAVPTSKSARNNKDKWGSPLFLASLILSFVCSGTANRKRAEHVGCRLTAVSARIAYRVRRVCVHSHGSIRTPIYLPRRTALGIKGSGWQSRSQPRSQGPLAPRLASESTNEMRLTAQGQRASDLYNSCWRAEK